MIRPFIKSDNKPVQETSQELSNPQQMHITIKDAAGATIRPASKPNLVNIEIEGIDPEELLLHVDIMSAIQYFGASELLDTIGEETLRSYLKTL